MLSLSLQLLCTIAQCMISKEQHQVTGVEWHLCTQPKNTNRRFATSTEQKINKLFEDKDSESLKRYTKTAQEVFHGRCKISLIAYSYLLFWKKIECVSYD